jgi:F-type H+-transporting ATPase subunit c
MKLVKTAVLAVAVLLLVEGAASAQNFSPQTATDAARVAVAGQPRTASPDLRAIGLGMIIMGAAFGIGGLAKSAVESMARQPETAGNIQTAMIIAAALIEGVTFFALIIVMLFMTPY